jgi:hypothetical protein
MYFSSVTTMREKDKESFVEWFVFLLFLEITGFFFLSLTQHTLNRQQKQQSHKRMTAK